MTDYAHWTGEDCAVEAQRRFQDLARTMIAQGMPAHAVQQGLQGVRGLGLRPTTSDHLKAAMGEPRGRQRMEAIDSAHKELGSK
jgi:hypothetical protein